MSSDTGTTVEVYKISCYGLHTKRFLGLKFSRKYHLLITVGEKKKKALVVESSGEFTWAGPIVFTVTEAGSMIIQVYAKSRNDLIGEVKLESLLDAFVPKEADEYQGVEIDRPLLNSHKDDQQGPTGVSIRFWLRCSKPKLPDFPRTTIENSVGSESPSEKDHPPVGSSDNPPGLWDMSKPSAEMTASSKKPPEAASPTTLRVIKSEDVQKMEGSIEKAMEKIKNISNPPMIKVAGDVVDEADKTVKVAKSAYELWMLLAQRVSAFVKIVDVIVEIHPYAKIAWTVLSQPIKIMLEQVKLDQEVEALLETMIDIYEITRLSEWLKKIDVHCDTLKLICQQTTECALFISEYASHKFGKRIITSFISGHKEKISAYQDAFKKLKQNLMGQSTAATGLIVFQMSAKMDEMLDILRDIHINQELNRLPLASDQSQHEGCDTGTRQAIIDEIIEWSTKPVDPAVERVYWLRGVAGCGKSAIAQSVSERLLVHRRCASFFFNGSTQTKDGLHYLYTTLSRDLARLNDDWKAALVRAIKESVKEPSALSPEKQFETFISQPAKSVDIIGPILIIIDALDESGSFEEHEALLSTLARFQELPIQFRFLLTSRPEDIIVRALGEGVGWVIVKDLDSVSGVSTSDDIFRFVQNRLGKIPGLKMRIDEAARQIADRSGGLFQWASTVCKYIGGSGKVSLGSDKRLKQILSSDSYDGLYGLYKSILDHLCAFIPGDDTERLYQTIMGRILSLREPLSLAALSELWVDEEEKEEVKSILSPMGSLLRGVSTLNEPIQSLHKSFPDFLRDKERSGKYYINTEQQPEMLSRAALREMQTLLKFNICQLETSYESNCDIPNLLSRVQQSIPSHLSYACRFWVDHLCAFTPTDEWYGRIQVFMQRYLLFWLEALSLLGRVDRALAQLSMLKDWLQSVDNCEELKQLVSDSLRFVEVAAPVLRQSTPHLYLSALPFVPRDSALSKSYLPAFPGSIDVEERDSIRWSAMLLSINASSKLWSIALSPDGKRIATGSEEKHWSIWDTETGDQIIGPISGHTEEICSVAFSPSGKRIASGSRDTTVRIWDAETGEIVVGPLIGHSKTVRSVTFSPDGQHIASGSFDKTIRIWNCATGAHIKTLANGHNDFIRSIAYSSDSKYIASGSDDHKVIIWKWETEETMILIGHNDGVNTVAFSHNGQRLVSGSYDKTIMTWSTETGKHILNPLTGHTGSVSCIAFSPDDRYIASGSMDNAVRAWDARTGALVAGPFEGHGNTVHGLVFSPDGKHAISGSWDETIKTWDVTAGRGLGNASDSHAEPVSSVTYSPDGSYFATASWDGTVRLWSATTGKSVREPFKGHTYDVYSIAFSPNGKQIVSGSRDESVRIWDVQTGAHLIAYSDAHTNTISCIASSLDGSRVVSGSLDGTVRVWDAETAMLVAGPFVGQAGRVSAVAFSSDGKRVVSSSSDAAMKIWDIESGGCIVESVVDDAGRVNTVAFSPNGKIIVSAFEDGSLRVCDVLTGELLMALTNISAVTSIAMSTDGDLVASGLSDKTVRVWDVRTGQPIAESFEHDSIVTAVAFSLDGCYIVSGSSDAIVRVWDVKTGLGVGVGFYGHSGSVLSVAFSPDRTRIVSGSADKRVLIWDLEKHNVIVELVGHGDSVHSVAFSADGQRIISGSADRSLKIWDTQTGMILAETFSTHTDLVLSVAFSPDGKRVASGSYDKSVRIWDAETGRLIGRPFLGHTDGIESVTFSPNSRHLASSSLDRTLRVWDGQTGQNIARPLNTDNIAACLAFSPNGTILISGLGNGNIMLWDTTTWNEKATAGQFQGHTRYISSIQFSSDGERVISSSYDKTVRIWDINTGKCIAGPFRHNDNVYSSALSFDSSHFVSGSRDNTVKIWNIDFGARDNSEEETSNTDHTLIPGKSHSHLEVFTDSSKFEDGWMRGPNNELLFWIPPDYRSSIWRPSNIALVGRMAMRLKLDRFTYGTDWAKCFNEALLIKALPDPE